MKTFTVVICVAVSCALVYGRPSSSKLTDIHNECQSNPATHLSDEVFRAIKRGESFNRTLVGAHMLCMSTKFGTQNEDGTINRVAVRNELAEHIKDEAKLEEVTNKCVVEGETPGETAIKLSQCVREHTHRGRHGHGHRHSHRHDHQHDHDHGHDHDHDNDHDHDHDHD